MPFALPLVLFANVNVHEKHKSCSEIVLLSIGSFLVLMLYFAKKKKVFPFYFQAVKNVFLLQ